MQVQNDNTSLEDLSRYRKLGYEHVEEEKVLLDSLLTLYRKRVEIAQSHLLALEELYSAIMADLDVSNSLYKPLAWPALDCLEKDIESHRHYIHRTQCDLDKVTFPMGPRSIVQSIKEATNAAKHLYPKYADSCQPALDILPHHNGWKSLRDERIGGFLAHCPSLTPEEITHRRLASILHPVQKAARLHFETSYPQLLDDHINYMEQIKHLIMSNATRRSEFSTAIACDANAERFLIDRFSTTDAITAPYQKMELEKDRREYRHAPVLNPVSRELEEERSVILGCDPMQKSDNVAEEVIIACLERYRSLYWQSSPSKYAAIASWKHCWGFIHMMETGYGVCETLLGVSRWEQVGQLIRLLVVNTHLSSRPFLNLTDQRCIDILQRPLTMLSKEDYWNSGALVDLMKYIHPKIARILKACALVYFVTRNMNITTRLLLCTDERWDDDWESKYEGTITAIFRRWDCDAWRSLPDDVEWGVGSIRDEVITLRRMKRFPATLEYGGDLVYLEVDAGGCILDTPENQKNTIYIKEERPRSWLAQKLQRSKR